MGYLKDSILVIVDCTELDARSREELFMNSRDRLSICPLRSEIESRLERLVKEHPGLRQLREQRRKEEINEKLQDSKPLVDVINQLINSSPSLSKMFVSGSKISNPFKLTEVGVGKAFVGKRYPTYFKLVNKSKGTLFKNCPINWRFRVQYETDAENNYFDRDDNPGSFILKASGQIINDYTLNLWNGKANITASLPNNIKAMDVIEYSSEMKDYARLQPFTDSFIVNVVPAQEHHKGGDIESQENGLDPEGKGRFITSSLAIPNIIEVRKEQWGNRKFDSYSALDVVSTGKGSYDFFVNIDNIHLLTELKYVKSSIELLNARYKYGTVLIGMTLLQEPKIFKAPGENASPSELIYEKIRQFTRAISPLLLPMISALGDLEVND